MKKILLPAILFSTLSARAQLYIDNATFLIDDGAIVTVQGDVFTNVNIQANGSGKIRMGGTTAQNINLNGFDVPNLQIDNASANIVMTGAGRITKLLEFTNGKIQLGNFDLTLASTASFLGAGTGKFAETNGTGVVKKLMPAAGSATLPIGIGSTYTPVDYTTSGGTHVASSFVSARSVDGAHPNKHPRSSDYLKSYWKLNNNITGATVTAVGNYADPASVTGNQPDIVAMYYTGTAWVKGTSQAATSVTAPAGANTSRDLYGMNKFLLVSPKVFLQGAFNATTGLMSDLLRNSGAYSPGNPSATNLIPTSDPYRIAPYNATFAHVNNPVAETLPTGVLNDLANPNDQIVDWVFVELRTAASSTSATIVQTRSVLLQRDGDLVDIDGVSPVYFKNLDPNTNYVVTVRHRNHLGVSVNPATALSLSLSTTAFDFTNTANTSKIYGVANTNYGQAGAILKNVLYAGNANFNTNVRYNGPSNDRDYILANILGSNQATVQTNVYSQGDVNLNRVVRYNGPSNDRDFILSNTLGTNQATVKNQSLPTN